jgi:peptide/nickel transport system permease protein
MWRYIARRILVAIPTLLGITLLIFFAMRVLPGDPIRMMLVGQGGSGVMLTDEEVEEIRTNLGLNRPLYVQYLSWIKDVLTGELGHSFWRKESIGELIVRKVPITLEIAFLSIVIGLLIGLPVGIASAVRRNSVFDLIARGTTTFFMAVPSFWLGIIILLITIRVFLWRPPLTTVYLWEDPSENLQIVIGPAITVGFGIAAILARFARSAMLEVLSEDYIRTAWAKGLNIRKVIWPHALKNAMLPVVTATGILLGSLLAGEMAVEAAFGISGLGSTLVQALRERDWMVSQNLILIYGVFFVVTNLVVDISYAWFDPRIRYE